MKAPGNGLLVESNSALLAVNHKYDSFQGSCRKDKKANERRKLFYEFDRENVNLAVFVGQHIAFLIFLFQHECQILLKSNRMRFCLVQQMRMLKHPVLFTKT